MPFVFGSGFKYFKSWKYEKTLFENHERLPFIFIRQRERKRERWGEGGMRKKMGERNYRNCYKLKQ